MPLPRLPEGVRGVAAAVAVGASLIAIAMAGTLLLSGQAGASVVLTVIASCSALAVVFVLLGLDARRRREASDRQRAELDALRRDADAQEGRVEELRGTLDAPSRGRTPP